MNSAGPADQNLHQMLQKPNMSAMLGRGDSSSRSNAKLNGSNAKGIKTIHQMIHRDKSHEKIKGAGSAMNMGGQGMDLDAPYLSQDDYGDGIVSENSQYIEKSNRKTPAKIKGIGAGLQGSSVKNTTSKKTLGLGYQRQGHEVWLPTYQNHKIKDSDEPQTMLDSTDYQKRLKFEELKKIKLDQMCKWKQKDTKGIKKNAYIKEIQKKNEKILSVADKDELEKLEVMTDRFPLLKLRKAVYKFIVLLNMVSKAIISTSFFDNFTTAVILFNCITMMLNNPIDENPPQFFADVEVVFLVLYTGEMVLKILGLGFVMGEGSYLRDWWNVMDFIIVITSLMSVGGEDPQQAANDDDSGGFNAQGMRAFRVARPLRTISSIKGLKVLVSALISALPMLSDTIIILFGFFLTFAIAGTQLFSGVLKQRCYNYQTGQQTPGLSLCAIDADCGGGYYCGKSNSNPNNGATNFDNVFYSLLVVFQTTTLEGWSDVQVQVEQVTSPIVVLYFTIIVFAGAFFLLNLTLAVINSKFTEAHNNHQSSEKDKNIQKNQVLDDDVELDENQFSVQANTKDDMSISQFITARIYAKKMIEFLRMRQEIKRIERERMIHIKEKQKIQDEQKKKLGPAAGRERSNSQTKEDKKQVPKLQAAPPPPDKKNNKLAEMQKQMALAKQQSSVPSSNIPVKIGQGNVIAEDPKAEEQSDGDHNLEVQKFYKAGINNMQRQGIITQNMNFPNRVNIQEQKKFNDHSFGIENVDQPHETGKPKMKGNIVGPGKKSFANKDQWQNFGQELDIDRVVGNGDSKIDRSNPSDFGIDLNSNRSFNLSKMNEDLDSNFAQSQRNDPGTRKKHPTKLYGNDLPGLTQNTHMTGHNGDESGLITSDSDFDKAADIAGYNSKMKGETGDLQQEVPVQQLRAFDIKRDISKTFKRMLTSNHARSNQKTKEKEEKEEKEKKEKAESNMDSTHYGDNSRNKLNPNQDDQETQISEIEKKFMKKQRNAYQIDNKIYKEDKDLGENYLESNFQDQNIPMLKTKKEDIRQLQEFVTTRRPKDPFKDLEPLKQKVDITKGLAYKGSSQNEIFETRIQNHQKAAILKKNAYLKIPDDKENKQLQYDGPIRTEFDPYQQKVWYQVELDSSEISDESNSTDEDIILAAEQPYMTPTQINFQKMTKQLDIPSLMKRSDILITSTLAMSIFPKDKRAINIQYYALMNGNEIMKYIDEKNAFNSLVKEYQYQEGVQREKDKMYAESFMKSFIYKQDFNYVALQQFQQRVKFHNLTKKAPLNKTKEEVKKEKFKHEQNKRASQKRGLPKFDMDQANKLLSGKFHEDEDEEDEIEFKPQSATTVNFTDQNQSSLGQDNQSHNLQIVKALHNIFEQDKEKGRNYDQDEIPDAIRKKYGLPKPMGKYEVDFDKIRNGDINLKKQLPVWSGQDVLMDKLDHQKSVWISAQLNKNRVWPTGMLGFWKRFRYYLRILQKSSLFDSSMTFCVLLNTVVLGLDHAGMSNEMANILNTANSYFTIIFIVEMCVKLIAIGFVKYSADKMNYLDGGVVMLSIFEYVIEIILTDSQSVSLSAFKTLRMLRTFRVFRIARLLKALKSMQTIIQVISKSYMSFFYIAMLMFLFIIIFSLLGSELLGGKIKGTDPSDPDTIPRGNFDSFWVALITVFQILTMENWQQTLFDAFYGQSAAMNMLITGYFISWIFLGNFILLNLFLAILLDSFLEEGEEEDLDELDHLKFLKKQRKALKLKRMNKNKIVMGENNERKLNKKQNQPSNLYFGQKPDSDEDLEDLDEDYIIEVFKEQGIIKQDEKDLMKKQPYKDKLGQVIVFCENSIYLFPKDNKFRLFMYKAIHSPSWDNSVMFLIFLSSFKLAFDSYTWQLPSNDPIVIYSDIADNFFNYLFILEMTSKLIAIGIVMDEGSYLRDSWNQLDFFIVMSSVVDMSLSKYKIGFVKILRALRVLRPLRMIAHNPELKMIINALLDSMGSITNVLFVIGIVYLIFAIIGVNLFQSRFYYCTNDPYKLHTSYECELASGIWKKWDFNYDDVISAMQTLYVVSSLEGWPDIMIQTIDMTVQDQGPIQNYSLPYYAYYIVFIFIGSFFFLNFFIGVLFMRFDQAQREENKGFTSKDLAWLDIQKLILSAEPDYETTNVPRNDSQRKRFHDLVSSSQFEKFIMTCIVFNIIQMSLNQENLTPSFTFFLQFSGWIFTAIFLVECILKLTAYGKTYFNNSWNQFDFVVVGSSLFDLLITFLDTIDVDLSTLSSLTQLARIARILRVTRILKLAGKDPGLQAILQTIQFSIPSLVNVGYLLVLIYFMFAIIGNFQFRQIQEGNVIDPIYKNFIGFHQSFLLVFAISTGEDWNVVMWDCNRTIESQPPCVEGINCSTGNILNFWYFYLLVLFCSHVMLNLFILVIIQQFEHYYLQSDNSISNYKNDLVSFMKVWKKWTQDRYQCKKIKENQLVNFFKELGEFGSKDESLGFSEEFYDTGELKKQLLKMGIKINKGFVYFNELLYRCMRRKYGAMKINKKMQIIELKNQIRIFEMGTEAQTDNKKISKDEIVKSIAGKVNGYNPFLAVMNFKISVKTWIKHARKNVKNMEKQKRIDKGDDDTMSEKSEEVIEHTTFAVEIEVEKVFSETCSDEDDDDDYRDNNMNMLVLSNKKASSAQRANKSSPDQKLTSTLEKKKTLRESMDHLELFSHKMERKFNKKNKLMRKAQSHADIGQSMATPQKDPNSSALGLLSAKRPSHSMYVKNE